MRTEKRPRPTIYMCLTCKHWSVSMGPQGKMRDLCFASGNPKVIRRIRTECDDYVPKAKFVKSEGGDA